MAAHHRPPMRASLFVEFDDPGRPARRLGASDRDALVARCGRLPGLLHARLHEPAVAFDPMLDDGPPPFLSLQIDFVSIDALSMACAADGGLQWLAVPGALPGVAGAQVTHQAMLTRDFAVPGGGDRDCDAGCAYLVSYDGPADNLDDWLSFYLTHHPPMMARLPGIRAIEVGTRLDAHGFLPWSRRNCMLRNKVVFDDVAALDQALASPVRRQMRADFNRFPPYAGGVRHHPMSMTTAGRGAGQTDFNQ